MAHYFLFFKGKYLNESCENYGISLSWTKIKTFKAIVDCHGDRIVYAA